MLNDGLRGNDMRQVLGMVRNPVVCLAGAVCSFAVASGLIGLLMRVHSSAIHEAPKMAASGALDPDVMWRGYLELNLFAGPLACLVSGALVGVLATRRQVLIAALAVLPFTALFLTSASVVNALGAVANVAAAIVGSVVTRALVGRWRARHNQRSTPASAAVPE